MQRERVSAKSDSQLVVAHINACHGYLTREDMWVGQGVIVDLVSGSFSFDRGERAENLPDLIFLRSDNFGSSCSLCFCVRVRERELSRGNQSSKNIMRDHGTRHFARRVDPRDRM